MSIVRLKNKSNGVTYVYESTSYWDKEKAQARNSRICIGKLDDETGEIVYNKRYLEKQKAKSAVSVGRVASMEHKRGFYGATYLFDAIGEKLGITNDLKQCYPESYKQILSIAYYLILEPDSPLFRFEKWGILHKHPYDTCASLQRGYSFSTQQ